MKIQIKYYSQFSRFVFDILDKEVAEQKKLESRDAETQTDPEITGVDADDFEEDDYSNGEEEDSETESSEDEEEEGPPGPEKSSTETTSSKGTLARPVPRKKIELKYYFGEDMPDSELKKRKLFKIHVERAHGCELNKLATVAGQFDLQFSKYLELISLSWK